jgi:uncharacterized membrane protein
MGRLRKAQPADRRLAAWQRFVALLIIGIVLAGVLVVGASVTPSVSPWLWLLPFGCFAIIFGVVYLSFCKSRGLAG